MCYTYSIWISFGIRIKLKSKSLPLPKVSLRYQMPLFVHGKTFDQVTVVRVPFIWCYRDCGCYSEDVTVGAEIWFWFVVVGLSTGSTVNGKLDVASEKVGHRWSCATLHYLKSWDFLEFQFMRLPVACLGGGWKWDSTLFSVIQYRLRQTDRRAQRGGRLSHRSACCWISGTTSHTVPPPRRSRRVAVAKGKTAWLKRLQKCNHWRLKGKNPLSELLPDIINLWHSEHVRHLVVVKAVRVGVAFHTLWQQNNNDASPGWVAFWYTGATSVEKLASVLFLCLVSVCLLKTVDQNTTVVLPFESPNQCFAFDFWTRRPLLRRACKCDLRIKIAT